MSVSLIVAAARNGTIGARGGLPWRLRDDMAYFAEMTMGKAVVMGRKTYESIPPKFRPLVGRRNIVITRQTAWQAEGVEVVGGLEEALALAGDGEVMVAGGGEIYALALGVADRLYITEVDAEVAGDTVFPIIRPGFDNGGWREVSRKPHQEGEWRYDWVVYERV